MITRNNAVVEAAALHRVGNQYNEEGIFLSDSLLSYDEELEELMLHYFLMPFKSEEYYHFYHEADINLNEVYHFATAIFENPEALLEQSAHLAQHLYSQSTHPNIKGGEFYTIYFRNCMIDGMEADAIGLFKSETKDTFLKVIAEAGHYGLQPEAGININRLDKGCLIFNTEQEEGYLVAAIDNTNRSMEARYWIDDFLHIRQRQDDYYNTHNILSMCKNFVTKELPEQFEVTKADQADLLNRSVQFFKEQDNFDMKEFSQQVIAQPEVIEQFQQYRTRYEEDHDMALPDQFGISEQAVKKQARVFKSVIKLDKNFHIYVHGNRELIERGEDEKGKFYKVYFKEEM